jgi:hypothetical protein
MVEGVPAPHCSTQPWWWWFASGCFITYMLFKYGGPHPVLALGVISGALVTLVPVVRLVRAWNGERIDQTTDCHVVHESDDDGVVVKRCRPDKWL